MEYLKMTEVTEIAEDTQQQLLLVDVFTPVISHRLSMASLKDYVLDGYLPTGLSHTALTDIGDYNHATIDGAIDDSVLHIANTYMHAGDSAWSNITPINSWVNWGGTSAPLRAKLDNNGYVHLEGVIKDGTWGTVCGELPVNMRPAYDLIYPVWCGGAVLCKITIGQSGLITPGGGSGYCAMSGITFRRYPESS